MATLGSKLVTKEMEWTANMTEQNHLGRALIAKPHVFRDKMDTIFSAQNYYSDNPLSSILMGNSKTEKTIGGTSWEWELKGASTRPLVIVENVEPASNTTPGKFKRPFKVKLDEKWWVAGDIIYPGTADKSLQLRIVDEPTLHGEGWVYNVVGMWKDSQKFLPVKYLASNTPWAKLYSQYEEGAEQSGSTQFSMPLSLTNHMGKYRKKYKVTDYASTEVLAVAMQDNKGKLHKSWIRYAEVEYWMQWYREIERGHWYSRSTDTVLGATGRPVRSGPGIQEQLEDSHVHRYTHLTAKLIEDYLMDIFYGRVKPGRGRKIKGYTGEYGMLQFHRAIENWMGKSGFVKNVEVFTNKVSSDIHDNALEGGYQFVRYNMANGSSLELVHNPLYDDREINFEIDEITGYPIESQRITFLDFSGDNAGSNIQIINKDKGYAFGYVQGLYGPTGPSQSGQMAHSGEYYEMHVSQSCGIHINDVTKCGELILSRN